MKKILSRSPSNLRKKYVMMTDSARLRKNGTHPTLLGTGKPTIASAFSSYMEPFTFLTVEWNFRKFAGSALEVFHLLIKYI